MTDPRDPRDSQGEEQKPPAVGKASVGRHEAPPAPGAGTYGAGGSAAGRAGAGGVYGGGVASAPGHYGQPAVPGQPAPQAPPPGVPGALSGPHAAAARPQAPDNTPGAPGTPPHGAPLPQRPPPPPLTQFANGPGGAVLGRDATLSSPAVQAAGPAPATTAPPVQAVPPAQTSSSASTRAATQAAAATATRAAAVPLSEARAIPDTTPALPPGTVYESRRPPGGGDGHRGLSGRLARLRIGSHTASRSALAQLRIASPGTGLILGADRQQGPVSVRFFRPEPTRIALVGGAWAGQLVTFRALALGARVAVVTADPQAWQGFGERATGRGDRVAVLSAEQPLAVTASAQQPILVVYDLGQLGATAPQPLGPWQTQLTILRQLSQPGVPSIQDCNLVMLQRLGSTEAALAGSSLRLPAASTQFLQVMADDMIALVGDGAERYIWFAQTDVERQYSGAPRR
ncbi:hypothetical protein [Micromonospora sp. CPCC 206061]|uniref:hypothetical protein n=1 Tax=Micromonospora sp. CPCC 206061 TaxID=3122410 RepID=UPI002FF0E148